MNQGNWMMSDTKLESMDNRPGHGEAFTIWLLRELTISDWIGRAG